MIHVLRENKIVFSSNDKKEIEKNITLDDVVIHYDRRMDFAIFYRCDRKDGKIHMSFNGNSDQNPHGFCFELKIVKNAEEQ